MTSAHRYHYLMDTDDVTGLRRVAIGRPFYLLRPNGSGSTIDHRGRIFGRRGKCNAPRAGVKCHAAALSKPAGVKTRRHSQPCTAGSNVWRVKCRGLGRLWSHVSSPWRGPVGLNVCLMRCRVPTPSRLPWPRLPTRTERVSARSRARRRPKIPVPDPQAGAARSRPSDRPLTGRSQHE